MTDYLFRDSLPPSAPEPEPPSTGTLFQTSLPPVEPEPPPEEPDRPFWSGDSLDDEPDDPTPPTAWDGPTPGDPNSNPPEDPDPVDPDPEASPPGPSPGDPNSNPPAETPTAGDPQNPSPGSVPTADADSAEGGQAPALAGLIDDAAISFGPPAAAPPEPPAQPFSASLASPSHAFEQEDGLTGNSSYGTAASDLFAFWSDWEQSFSAARKLPPDWLDI